MIKAVIVDDEQACINNLSSLLKANCRDEVLLCGAYQTVEEGISGIIHHTPDLLFLDVHIGDANGFDLLQQLSPVSFDVIFTTAYDKYAIKAIRFSALDYLLKPIDNVDLLGAIRRVTKKKFPDETSRKLDMLMNMVRTPNALPKKISIPTINGLTFLNIGDIIRCEANVNYTVIYMKERQKLMVAKTLKEFEEMLSEHNFFRVHNSHLINLEFIKSYNRGKGGVLTMSDGTEVEVSVRKKDDFLKKLEAFNV